MSIQNQIKEQLKESMKARDEVRTLVLKGLLAGFTNELVAQRKKPSEELPDADALNVIKKMVKQRKDSIEQFRKGNREDLATSEEKELAILNTYLPETMSKEEILKIAIVKKDELGITDKSKMGMLVGAIIKELKDKADSEDVKEVVEKLFQ
ncbi:MAG: GatB/YqeY domain-containing protein [Candidatus Pacebacteria bacterium]|nr:GatB/YqeY domain-containing protein [Candidatus Paceibacterota bacterium]